MCCWGKIARTVGKVVDEVESILVVNRSEVGLGDSQTDTIGKALAERTSGDLNT